MSRSPLSSTASDSKIWRLIVFSFDRLSLLLTSIDALNGISNVGVAIRDSKDLSAQGQQGLRFGESTVVKGGVLTMEDNIYVTSGSNP